MIKFIYNIYKTRLQQTCRANKPKLNISFLCQIVFHLDQSWRNIFPSGRWWSVKDVHDITKPISLSVSLTLFKPPNISLFLSVSLSLFKPLSSGWICFEAQPCTPLLRRAVFSLSRWSSSLVPLDEATSANVSPPFCHNCRPAKLSNGSKPSRDCTRVRVRRTRRTEVRKTWQFQSELSYGTQTDRQTNRA